MANTVLGTHGSGNHAGRPAGNAVPDGSLYSCTTHSLIYVSSYSGNSWSTWASLSGTGMTDPMTTRGDIIVRDASNVTNRLAVGAAGRYLMSDGTDVLWGAAPVGGAYKRTSGNYTTSSTTFADIDGTNISFALTTRARRVLIGQMASVAINNAAGEVAFDVTVDGTRQGDAFGIVYVQQHATVGEYWNASFTYLTDVLTAGAHTFTIQWKVGSGAHTATLLGSSGSGMFARFYAMEMGG